MKILRCPRSFMPFGGTKIALASERFIKSRNLEKIRRKWSKGLSHNLVVGSYVDTRRARKIGSHNGAR